MTIKFDVGDCLVEPEFLQLFPERESNAVVSVAHQRSVVSGVD
jgi:hypothetical protein